MPKADEKITKTQCAYLVYSAENEHRKTALITGALSGAAMFVTILSPLFGIAIMMINVAYAVFTWKKQSQKLAYLAQTYFARQPPVGGI